MWVIPLTVLMIVLGIIYMQERHYEYTHKVSRHAEGERFYDSYESTQKEIKELKARVDALTVRAGFKL